MHSQPEAWVKAERRLSAFVACGSDPGIFCELVCGRQTPAISA